MPYVTVGKENSGDIEIYYEDYGSGQPVVLIHGYPVSGASWEEPVPALPGGRLQGRYLRPQRVRQVQPTDRRLQLRHVRRGSSRAGHPAQAARLHISGFSMGGGEVARYIGKYGSKDMSKAVVIFGVPPYLLKTGNNPEGVDASVFASIEKAVAADRYAFFTGFFQNFYNTDLLMGKRVSEQAVQASWDASA